MTLLGKILVFLNLIGGIGVAVYSTSIYTNRPPWHEDFKDVGGYDKGHAPLTFKQLDADIDSQVKSAALASSNWGVQQKALLAAENVRAVRHVQMFGKNLDGSPSTAKGLINSAHEGNPAINGGGFLNLVEDPATKLLNLKPDLTDFKRVVVNGPNDLPLGGTDKLLDQFTADSAVVETQAYESKKLRAEQRDLTLKISGLPGEKYGGVQGQVHKQQEIRDQLVIEAANLAAFEVNATLNRDTFTRRRQQLIDRLVPFQLMDKK